MRRVTASSARAVFLVCVDRGTDHGRDVMAGMWPANEMAMLGRAWAAGANVPYPVERTEDGLLMEFIGDDSLVAAPRLVNAALDRPALGHAWQQLLADLRCLTRAGVVHAITNPAAADLLHRDVVNVATWFGHRGLGLDAEATFVDLLRDLP